MDLYNELSANDLAEVEELTGHAAEEVGAEDLSFSVRARIMACCYYLIRRKTDPGYTFGEALDAPVSTYLPDADPS